MPRQERAPPGTLVSRQKKGGRCREARLPVRGGCSDPSSEAPAAWVGALVDGMACEGFTSQPRMTEQKG